MITDEMPGYPKALIHTRVSGLKHKTIRHRDKVYVERDIHTNTVESAFSLLKRGIIGTWHKIIRGEAEAVAIRLRFPLILSLPTVHIAQISVR
jgi:hypothetical protein